MKILLDSIAAASRVGPKARSPRAAKASTSPAASGASGPTIVRAISRRTASPASASKSSGEHARQVATEAMPGLPGAQNGVVVRSSCARAHASACSLPPDPITRTDIAPLHRRASRRGELECSCFTVVAAKKTAIGFVVNVSHPEEYAKWVLNVRVLIMRDSRSQGNPYFTGEGWIEFRPEGS